MESPHLFLNVLHRYIKQILIFVVCVVVVKWIRSNLVKDWIHDLLLSTWVILDRMSTVLSEPENEILRGRELDNRTLVLRQIFIILTVCEVHFLLRDSVALTANVEIIQWEIFLDLDFIFYSDCKQEKKFEDEI